MVCNFQPPELRCFQPALTTTLIVAQTRGARQSEAGLGEQSCPNDGIRMDGGPTPNVSVAS